MNFKNKSKMYFIFITSRQDTHAFLRLGPARVCGEKISLSRSDYSEKIGTRQACGPIVVRARKKKKLT